MKRLALLKMGTAAEAVRLRAGDYDQWFFRTLGLRGMHIDVVPLDLGVEPKTPLTAYDGVLITGSPLSLTRPLPWMDRAAAQVCAAVTAGTPVLGVCFGLQLLAHGFGVRVVRNPLGREIGSVQISLTPAGRADPLFEGFPNTFSAQATHEDIVPDLPAQATLLASNASTRLQAVAFGKRAWGVQFHPELPPDGMRAVVESRSAVLESEARARGQSGSERVRTLLAGIQPTPLAARLLRTFAERLT